MKTIITTLKEHARFRPHDIAFTFIDDFGHREMLDYHDLDFAANAIANRLLTDAKVGDRVVLLIPQSLQYVKAFFGCLYAGVIAVPLYPPLNNKYSERVTLAFNDCDAKIALCSREVISMASGLLESALVLNIDECENLVFNEFPPNFNHLAFLQYTSGSTAAPKGVMVSHENIISNLISLQQATSCTSKDIFCNWLPLYHDLGLVNTILLPVFLGCHSILMSTNRFIKRPLFWLSAISEYKASICGAPNFAYDQCIKRIKLDQIKNIDLISWRIAFNAAEPVDFSTLENFSGMFSVCGFRNTAFYPSYGMAEATVFISGGNPRELYVYGDYCLDGLQHNRAQHSIDGVSDTKKSIRLVSCGKVQENHFIKIVDPELGLELNEGMIGEIWFSGPSVTDGYWGDKIKTTECFNATLKNDKNSYLKTGDLGFLDNNNLFISGRLKDVIIIKGRNYYPQDLERQICSVCFGVRQNGVVAFECSGRVVVVVEIERRSVRNVDFRKESGVASGRIIDLFGLFVNEFVFIESGSLTKTSSGKLQRSLTKQRYVKNELNPLYVVKNDDQYDDFSSAEWLAPEGEIEKYLADVWCEILGRRISRRDNFFALGGQSITAIEMIAKINQMFGISVPISALFECDNLQLLADYVECLIRNKSDFQNIISPIKYGIRSNQMSLWLVDRIDNGSPQYNMTQVFKLQGELNVEALTLALETVIHHHVSLRTIYLEENGDVVAKAKRDWRFELVHTKDVTQEQLERQIALQQSQIFDLSNDLMMRAHLFHLSAVENILLLCFHHIAVDGASLSIIGRDITRFYKHYQVSTRSGILPADLDVQTIQENIINSELVSKAEVYWRLQLENVPELHMLMLDYSRPTRQSYKGGSICSRLDPELSKKIALLSRLNKTTTFATLQTAFSAFLYRYSGQRDIVLGVPYAGRESQVLRDTVGCYVNPLVLRTDFSTSRKFSDQLKSNSFTLASAIQHSVISFVELVNLMCPHRSLGHHPLFQIFFSFNEFNSDMLFFEGVNIERVDPERKFSRFDLALEITADEKGFSLVWEYAAELFERETILNMQLCFSQFLSSIVTDPDTTIDNLEMLPFKEKRKLLDAGIGPHICAGEWMGVHKCLEAQVLKTPENIVAKFSDKSLSFIELNVQANGLAHYLVNMGVKPGAIVAVCLERGLDMLVALWGILKAGAAYLPLDPGYPAERLEYMMIDSKAKYIICSNDIIHQEGGSVGRKIVSIFDTCEDCIVIDINNRLELGDQLFPPILSTFDSNFLAYVIYTSGSTGRPKGVPIRHANVLNFFSGLNEKFPKGKINNWLAVTSICFDISVLELLWTCSRGDCIVIQPDRPVRGGLPRVRSMTFGLFYFASNSEHHLDKYELLLDGAKFADENDLRSVWIPERHFHPFGGQFPNPAVAAAAVSAVTKNITIHSGSVVLPLHDPLRVAEEWAMVDNFSSGRVALSIASGWQKNDFVLAPEEFDCRNKTMKRNLDIFKHLWAGGTINRVNGVGEYCEVGVYPRPIQNDVPIWIAAAGNIETFTYAGEIGANILTHLLGQSLDDLRKKIDVYRLSLSKNGFDPDKGIVTLMLHTFIDDDDEVVAKLVEAPLKRYLVDSISLLAPLANELGLSFDSDQSEIIDHAYQRYYQEAGLFGTPQKCFEKIQVIQQIGVDDIACLIDFGVDNKDVLSRLHYIKRLQSKAMQQASRNRLLARRFNGEWCLDKIIDHCDITHVQCTPSYAREISQNSLMKLSTLLVGGEAMPPDLAEHLTGFDHLDLYNMYGPTETTVWVSIKRICVGDKIYLAGPMANTQFLVLDSDFQIVPVGVMGELFISGLSVASGYLNQPDLSSERFCKNPFVDDFNAGFEFMYRTGDYVRWVLDKNNNYLLEYLGRSDHQVKINGHRIDLAEIEVALNKIDSVEQAVVVYANNKLNAYLVAQPESEIYIKRTIERCLPSFMHPNNYILVDHIPLTENGKIDRNAMHFTECNKKVHTAPSTETERMIHKIWSDTFRHQNVGIDDDFFSLGGNSLIAIKVISEINKQLKDISLEVKDLFMSPTILGIAISIQTKLAIKNNSAIFSELQADVICW